MRRTSISRQVDAAERAEWDRRVRDPWRFGRVLWNGLLASTLVGIAAWVQVSPSAVDSLSVAATGGPLAGRADAELVDAYSDVLAQELLGGDLDTASAVAMEVDALRAQALVAEAGAQGAKVPISPSTTAAARKATATTVKPVKKPTPTTKPPVTIPNVNAPSKAAVMRPSKAYYGVAAPGAPFDMTSIDAFSSLAGKRPNLIMGFQTWDSRFQRDVVAKAWQRNALPVITWEPAFKAGPQPKLADIANGAYDPYIIEYATRARDAKHPLGIRFAHEMNGRWYPWSEALFGNAPGDYVRAWRHIHDVFQAVGATNVIWIWSPNVVGSNSEMPLSQVYPGDEYVDWLGLSGYYRWETERAPSFQGTFGSTLTALRGVSAKPILLAEIGAGTTIENRVTWLDSLFAGMAANPDIIGFSYFNYDKSARADSQDWRIEIAPEVSAAFRGGVLDPRYGAGR